MKQQITDHLQDPEALEKLYRENRREFSKELLDMPEENDSQLIRFWKIRLAYEPGTARTFFLPELIDVLIFFLLTAVLIKLPAVFPIIQEEFFYAHNAAIIVFNGLILYTFSRLKVPRKWFILYIALILGLLVYVNLLPDRQTDSLNLALVHIPLYLWCLFGMAFISFDSRNTAKRIAFIRYNGELLIMTGLLLITGAILTAMTIGLFSAIHLLIEDLYAQNIAIPAAAASPILAAYLIRLYPDITRRILPVIARVFAPIALVTLVIYLLALAVTGEVLLRDRDLLIIFNIMLAAITAVIVFSVTELDKNRNRNIHVLMLLLLAIVTLVINAIALIAIINRVADGLTPNRLVVLCTNVLVFVNLILIAKDLFRSWYDAEKLVFVERTVANYLTVYFCWTVFAVFLLPLLFQFN